MNSPEQHDSMPLSELDSESSRLRVLLKLAWPMVVSFISGSTMQLVDAYMVSKYGKSEVAALGPAGIYVWTPTAFLMGIMSCNNTFVSQAHGRRAFGDCSRFTWQAVYSGIAGGLCLLLLWPLAPDIFRLSGHKADVQALEVVYFRLRILGVPANLAAVALATYFQGTGRPLLPAAAAIVSNVFNVLANYALIFGHFGLPSLGIGGAALGTVFSMNLWLVILMCLYLRSSERRKCQTASTARIDRARTVRLVRLGLPVGVTWLLDTLSWSVFTHFIVGRFGENALAANTIVFQLLHFSFMPTIGVGVAVTVITGQLLGRRRIDDVRRMTYTALKVGMIYMGSVGLCCGIFRYRLVGLFRGEPEVIRLAAPMLICAAIFQVFDATCIVMSSTLRGAGETFRPALLAVLLAWLVFLPSAVLFAFVLKMGPTGAWMGATVYICCLGLSYLLLFLGGRWQRLDIFGRGEPPPATPPTSYAAPEV